MKLRDDTLSRRASLNAAAAILDYGARLIVGFIANPILVGRLGDVAFGVYQTLGRLVGYATPAGGRPSQALKWTIARHQHSEELDEKRMQVGSALAVWVIFFPPMALIGVVLAYFAPVVLGLPESMHLVVRVAAWVLVVNLIVENLLLIPQSVVQGENLGYKRFGTSTLIVLAGGAATIGAAEAGLGLVGVAGALLLTTMGTGLLFLRVARQHVAWFGTLRPPRGVVRAFMVLSGWFLAWNMVMQLMRASDFVVLGIAGSPVDVTVYTLARYVPEAIFNVVAIAIAAVMPGLGGLLGRGDTERAATVRSESMAITWLLATSTGAAYLLMQESFISLWVGPEYVPSALAATLIVVMTLQFAFIRNDASIIDLTLELKGKVLLGLVSALVAIAIASVLVAAFDLGLAGLAAGFIAGRAIVGIAYPVSVARTFGTPVVGQFVSAVRPALVTAALFAGALAAAPHLRTDSWLLLVALALAGLAVFAVLSLALGLAGGQRRRLVRRARGLISR